MVSILIAFLGALCLRVIPVAEYPEIAPTMVVVNGSYSGASAQVVSETVAIPLEDEINGVDDVLYFITQANNNGGFSIYVTFRSGTNPDMNLVNLQNAVKRAEPRLPKEVTQKGISVKKRQEDRVAMYCFITDGRAMNLMDLGNFVERQVADAVQRIEGVALVESTDRQYAMRVWLNPQRMSGLGITIFDVKSAIESQNVQAAAGTVGGEYASNFLNYKLNVRGRLKTAEEFENIVVRTNPDTGAQVLLRDVARVEVGTKSYLTRARFQDNLTIYMNVYKAPEANSLTTMARVQKEIDTWMNRLPPGVTCVLADDTTAFTVVFLRETFKTLLIALVLVILITYLFLQDWRATLVPAIAIPISLIGAFGILYPFGFTLNVLTMFGLILVIGSLVDDAIVVVENTQALMLREGLSAKAAAEKSMRQITSAVIATSLVTLACYIPLAFYQGMVGRMYVQFAVAMCVALCLSTTVALTLSPVLCAYILKPPPEKPPRVFAPVNFTIDLGRRTYLFFVKLFVRRTLLTFVLFGAVLWCGKWLSGQARETLLPKEDRGYIRLEVTLPEGSSLSRTIDVVDQIHNRITSIPGVASLSSTAGSSTLNGTGENYARVLVRLDHWDKRKSPELQLGPIMDEIKRRTADIYSAKISAFTPPAINGLGSLGGVGVNLCASGDISMQALADEADRLVRLYSAKKEIKTVATSFFANTPQLYLDLDRRKAEALGITPKTVFSTLQNKLASFYVNDFNMAGGAYEVIVQSEADFRASEKDVMDIRLPGRNGDMVPLSSVGSLSYTVGPRRTRRYNKMPCAYLNIQPEPDVPALTVIKMLEKEKLAPGFHLEWSGLSFQEKENEGQLAWLMALSVFFAYLFLVAQYESWTIPLSVMLSVAFALTGGFLGMWLTDTPMSIYAQLGCVMLIGLSAKNAILMVEFSRQERKRGVPIADAALNGASMRFRAVMMTAWSFLFGVAPLVVATGAGAYAQRAIGITTFTGMLVATLVGVIFVPALYAAFQRLREKVARK